MFVGQIPIFPTFSDIAPKSCCLSRATTAGTPSGAGIRLTSTAGGKAKRQLHGRHNGVGGSRGGQTMHKWRFNQQR